MSISALRDYTFTSKYARWIPEKKRRETWKEAVDRGRNMMLEKYQGKEIDTEINWAYDLVMKKKVLGSQRGLQFSGKPILQHNMRLYNCVATYCDRLRFFQEAMYILLCGSGMGFSVQSHHIDKLPSLLTSKRSTRLKKNFIIPDSIEGWADAIGVLISSYFIQDQLFSDYNNTNIQFDYSKIRPKGSYLSSSSGKAPGADPLKRAINNIRGILDRCIEEQLNKIRPIHAYDIVMYIADAVLSGGVRRSATLCLFSPDDKEMATAKTGDWQNSNPQRGRSNNSALLLKNITDKSNFLELMESTKSFGDPGWLWADNKELTVNACSEIGMYAYDLQGNSGFQSCNLSTINCAKVKTKEDFLECCKAASIIGSLQAGFTDFPYLGKVTENIIRREALLGVSMTGMMECPNICLDPKIQKEGAQLIKKTNKDITKKIGINQAARTTCLKPEGCRPINSLITTEQGIFTLGEILENHDIRKNWQVYDKETYSHGGRITNTFINGIRPIIDIQLKYGINLQSTANHPWFVKYKIDKSKNKYKVPINQWKQANNLQPGDVLDIDLLSYDKNQHSKLEKEYRLKAFDKHLYNVNDIIQPDILDEELSWLLGYIWGDGCMKISKYRLSFIDEYKNHLEKVQYILKNKFNIDSNIFSAKNKNAFILEIGNKFLWFWLIRNNIYKYDEEEINLIPKVIRQSSKSDIISFISGLIDSDGSVGIRDKKNKRYYLTFTTSNDRFADHFQQISLSIGLCFGKSLNIKGQNYQSKNGQKHIWLMALSAHVDYKSFEILARNSEKIKNLPEGYNWSWQNIGSNRGILGKVKNISNGQSLPTFDVETEKGWFYAGSVKSHNTSSCMLGCSSGVHPHHAKRYIRRVQANKMETPYQFFQQYNSLACEESVWGYDDNDGIISFCIEVPDGSKTKNQLSAIDLLQIVKSTQQNWVYEGKNKELCTQSWLTHNVSNTIHIKENEWKEVSDFIYNNRKHFCGITLLSLTGDKDYPQAPFTTIYLPSEIAREYGDSALLCSGLIEKALELFDDDLWQACDILLYNKRIKGQAKQEWKNKCHKFAYKYNSGNIKKLTYCMKDVYNYKRWIDLNREYKNVDFTKMHESKDTTQLLHEPACYGGTCELT